MRNRVILKIGLAMIIVFLPRDPTSIALSRDPSVKKMLKENVVSQCSILDPLDATIQDRFRKGDLTFGFRRVGPLEEHLSHFKSKSDAEWNAVAELESNQWQVAFYLAGRKLLYEKDDGAANGARKFNNGPGFHGPVAMTPNTFSRAPLTQPPLARTEARTALKHLVKNNQYEASFGKWELLARPLRATSECLKCHITEDRLVVSDREYVLGDVGVRPLPAAKPKSSLKTGDLLGAAIYIYRRTPR